MLGLAFGQRLLPLGRRLPEVERVARASASQGAGSGSHGRGVPPLPSLPDRGEFFSKDRSVRSALLGLRLNKPQAFLEREGRSRLASFAHRTLPEMSGLSHPIRFLLQLFSVFCV